MTSTVRSHFAMGASLSSLPAPERRRLRLAAAALLLALYARRTAASARENIAILAQRQVPLPRGELLRSAARYTLWGQLIAGSEFLIALVKPSLAGRIGRSLVWKPQGTVRDAVYGSHARNTLDLYGATAAEDGKRKPVVVFVHGGAWSFGHKWQYALVGEHLAQQGALVAVVNYRTYPTGSAVDMVDDVERAVFWAVDHCREFGGDERRVFLSGHSSGAHVSALALTLSALRLAGVGGGEQKQREVAREVAGFIGLAAPYHIADHYVFESERVVGPINGVHEISSMKPAMLGESNFDRLSPTALIEGAAVEGLKFQLPPFYLIHGVDDTTVPTSSSKRLAAALQQADQAVEYVELPNCTHEGIVFAAMGDPVECLDSTTKHFRRILFASPLSSPPASLPSRL